MAYFKVELSSIHSVSFRQTRYIKIDDEDLNDNGTIDLDYEDELMNDVLTDVVQVYATLVDNEGD